MKKYTLALFTAIVFASAANAMTENEMQIPIEDGKIFTLSVITLGGSSPFSGYTLPAQESLDEALKLSKTSEMMRTELIKVLTTTLTGTPAGWHEAFCARAAVALKDERLNKIALDVIKVGVNMGDSFPDYIPLKKELIAQNPALTQFFNS